MKKGLFAFTILAGVLGLWATGLFDFSPVKSQSEESSAPPSDEPVPLRGKVVNSNGEGIPDAHLQIGDRKKSTNKNGEFGFPDLQAGTKTIEVRASGYSTPGPGKFGRTDVEISSGETRSVTLTLRRPISINGMVTASGDPVEGAEIDVFYKYADGLRGELDSYVLDGVATTNAKGEFKITDIPPGRIQLFVETSQHPMYESEEFYLQAGKSEERQFELIPEGKVAGRVQRPSGEAVEGASVILEEKATGDTTRAETTEKGSFQFPEVRSGKVKLRVKSKGYYSVETDLFVVENNETARRNIKLEPGNGLFGKVLKPDGTPVDDAYVLVRRKGRIIKAIRTSSDGKYEWVKPRGTLFEGQGYSPHYEISEKKSLEVGRETILTLRPGGTLKGRVITSNGEPINRFKIAVETVEAEGPGLFGSRAFAPKNVKSKGGAFKYDSLRPAKYYFRVKAEGYPSKSFGPIQIEGGKTKADVTFELTEGGVIMGQVVDKKNEDPIQGAQVQVFQPNSKFESRTARTDREGKYRLENIPAGRQSLRVRKKGYLTQLASGIEVIPGDVMDHNVVMPKKKPGQRFGFHGIGASLAKKDDGGVIIRRAMPGHPAERSGLKSGDVIREVERKSVEGMRLSDVVNMIRGRKGESVRLKVDRPGEGTFSVNVVRGDVVVEDDNKRDRGKKK